MHFDPHYTKILERLNGKLNPYVFEDCVPDLLRKHDRVFAVPIRGGSDSGMDGAVADREGERIPIVSTISNDVSGNLERNLKKYKCDGGLARVCIVATSRSLTPRRQQNLTEKARELDFTLLQIVDQSGIAARLYHDSKWCKELLHLTGQPSALSVIPLTSRPLPVSNLIGRTAAREWLRKSHGDRLLVGEPGAGKTSLLYELAMDKESGALFLVDDDLGEIANAIRDQQPKTVIVDDAHADLEFLAKLRRLRQEIRGDFDILATCWNGDRDDTAKKLNARPENAHELKRLSQDDVAEIVINAGIIRNHWLVNEIVAQAGGLPGLAGTLAYFALQGRWRDIFTGEALATDIARFYKNRISGDVSGLLACFALGGNSGMGKDAVSETLRMSRHQLRQDLSNLAHGGIIAEVSNRKDFIRVRPPALRHVLIRDVFFSGATALPESCLQELLAAVPEHIDTVREFIHVTRRWGNVPPSLIQKPLKEFMDEMMRWIPIVPSSQFGYSTPSLIAVREYAWLGPKEANWVIDNFTANLSHIARPLLQNAPERVIPCLLTEAIGDTRPLNSNTEHPIRLLQDWIKQAHPGTAEPLHRRAKILQGAKSWLSSDYDSAIGYSAMLLAVLPHFDFSENEPGSGSAIKIYSGFLIYEHLQKLQNFWEEIIECTRVYAVSNWEEFLSTVGSWAYPFHGNGPDKNTRRMMTDFAQKMAIDVLEVASDHVGVLHRLKALMNRSYPDFEIVTDVAINILYPIERLENDRTKQEIMWKEDADKLADQWSAREPKEIVARLEHFENEISMTGRSWPRLSPYLCYRLAEKTSDPLKWFDAMRSTSLPVDTVEPFLLEAVHRGICGWKRALQSCFQTAKLQSIAVKLILTQENASNDLKQAALDIAGEFLGELELLLWSDQLSQATILKLFNHPNRMLVSKLAVAAWQHKPKGRIEDWLRPHWEDAVVEYSAVARQDIDDYWLADIFSVESKLGARWLESRFKDESFESFWFEKSIGSAVAGLNEELRQYFIELIPDDYRWSSTAAALVGDSPESYRKLLSLSPNELDTLAPLSRPKVNSEWFEFAKLALEYGHTTTSIASRAFGDSFSYSGNLSNVYKSRYEQFETFRVNNDELVQRIAIAGHEYFLHQYNYWHSREAEEAVFGRE
ncbi:MAG: ATP-binding protein [Chloroflexi bacterium]|nr:ATP-binding protein [Chloroflexota bacterium]